MACGTSAPWWRGAACLCILMIAGDQVSLCGAGIVGRSSQAVVEIVAKKALGLDAALRLHDAYMNARDSEHQGTAASRSCLNAIGAAAEATDLAVAIPVANHPHPQAIKHAATHVARLAYL